MVTDKQSRYRTFGIIAFIVIVFNLIAIFGVNVLLHDDPKHYRDAIQGNIHYGSMRYFVLWPYTEFIAWKIMAFSAHFTRGLYVVLFMVPLSWCFYYLYHYKFGLPRLPALTAAIIPNVLPHQWQIPAGINMSRTLYPLLIIMIAVIMGFRYLEKETRRDRIRLVICAFLYLISTQMMEQALFLFIPITLLFLGYTKLNKKHIWLISSFSLIAAVRLIQMVIFTRKARILASPGEMIERTNLYFKYGFPSPDIEPIFILIFCMGIILLGCLLYFKYQPFPVFEPKENYSHLSPTVFGLYLYMFLISWAVSTIIPFLTMGGVMFPPRYSYISSFGINAIFVFSVFIIINSKFLEKCKPHYFVFSGIIIFSGVARYTNLKGIFDAKNKVQSIIIKDLRKVGLPKNAQVVVTDIPQMATGRNRSSGYLMHALKRNDISGVFITVAPHVKRNFFDYFNPRGITAKPISNFQGIYADRPVFFFALHQEENKLKQFEYVLYWKGKTRNAPWEILKADKKIGSLTTFRSGIAMEDYLSTLKQLEEQRIPQSEILWGGPASGEDQKRLDHLEFDPKLFQFGFYCYPKQFEKIDPSVAENIMSILNTMPPLVRNIDFGAGFRLEAVLLDQVSDLQGDVTNIIHFLWISKRRQVIDNCILELFFLKEEEHIYRFQLRFCHAGMALDSGDYILGNFKILGNQLQQAESLSVRMIVAPGISKPSVYPRGSRLIIPISPSHQR